MSRRYRRRAARRRLPHRAGPPPRGPRHRGRLGRLRDLVDSPVVVAAFFVTVSAVFGWGAVIAHDLAAALKDRGVRTKAQVEEVHDGRSASVDVSFTDAKGREVRARVGDWVFAPAPRVGELREIVYDPQDPQGNVADVRYGVDYGDMWFLLVGSVLAGGAGLATVGGWIDWADVARRR